MSKKFLAAIFLAACSLCFSQTPKEKILAAVSNYYNLDRESIFVHFDKTVFFTNEKIWFKGYAFNKKNNTPFFVTTNVYAVLYDDSGQQLDEQMIFSYNGTFSGDFKLGDNFKSGRYYILFYTNWMNNFTENESSMYAVDIVNEKSSDYIDYNAPSLSKVNIQFQPEGGNFVTGIVNNLGVKISDCNGNTVPIHEGIIVNSKGETIKNFVVSKSGFGKVYLTPTGDSYKAVFNVNGKNVEADLPKSTSQGLALEVNNYALADKTIIRVKTNAQTVNSIPSKTAMVIIQQNDKANIFDLDFNDGQLEKELAIANENLFPGANIIRVVDQNLNQMAERMIFEFPVYKSELELHVMKTVNDTITMSGKIAYPNANISVSIMPENTISDNQSSVYGAFLFDPYLKGKAQNTEYYLNDPSRNKRYEMDLFLMNQTLKYDWKDIISITPKMTYDFDIGLTVKGNLINPLPDPKNHRIRANAPFSFLNDYSPIDGNSNYTFKNLVLADETYVNMTLMRLPSVPVAAGFFQKVVNRKRNFIKPLEIPKPMCEGETKKIALSEMPQFAGKMIMLSEVELKGKPKSDLSYRNRPGNSSLRGHKVTEMDNTMTVLDYIGRNGFTVSNYAGRVTITGRAMISSINGAAPTPEISINGRRLLSYDELADMQMDDVDEIYLNPHAIVPSMNNNRGIIKIYLRKLEISAASATTKRFLITDGFAGVNWFENPPILSTAGKGFENYGVIQWIPAIVTNQTGGFSFQVPKTDVKSVKIHIQGFTSEGKLISETVILPVP